MNNLRQKKLFDTNQKLNKTKAPPEKKPATKFFKNSTFTHEEDYGRLLEEIMHNEDLYHRLKEDHAKNNRNKSPQPCKETDHITNSGRGHQEHSVSQNLPKQGNKRVHAGTPQKTKNPLSQNELDSVTNSPAMRDCEGACIYCQVGTPKSSIPVYKFNPTKVPLQSNCRTPHINGQMNKTRILMGPLFHTGQRRPPLDGQPLQYEVGYYVDPNESAIVQKLECDESHYSAKRLASITGRSAEGDTRSITERDDKRCSCKIDSSLPKIAVQTQTQEGDSINKMLTNCSTQTSELVKPAKLNVMTQATDQAKFVRSCAQRVTAKAQNLSTNNRRGRGAGRVSATTSSRSTVGQPSPSNLSAVNPWNIGHIKAMIHEIRDVAAATRDADLDRIVNDLEWAVRSVLCNNTTSTDARAEMNSFREENDNLKKQLKKAQDQLKDLTEKATSECMTESCKKKETTLKSEISEKRLAMDNLSSQFDCLQIELKTAEEERDKISLESQNLLLVLCQKDTELIQARHCFLQTEAKLKEEINSYIEQLAELENNFMAVKHQLNSREQELHNCQTAVREVHQHLAQFMNHSGVRERNDNCVSRSAIKNENNPAQMLRQIYHMLSPTKEETDHSSSRKKSGKSVRIVCDEDKERTIQPADTFPTDSTIYPDTNDPDHPANKSSSYSESSESSRSSESSCSETQQSSTSQLTRDNLKEFDRKQKEFQLNGQNCDITAPASWCFSVQNEDSSETSSTKDAILTVPSSKERLPSSIFHSKEPTHYLETNATIDLNESNTTSATCTSATLHLTVAGSSSGSKSPSPSGTKLIENNQNDLVSLNNNHFISEAGSNHQSNSKSSHSRKSAVHSSCIDPDKMASSTVNRQDSRSVCSDMKESCHSALSSVSSLRSNDDWKFKYGLEKLDAEIRKLQSSLKHSVCKAGY